ncbi:dynactin subunit 3 [Anabrus simplex]|uniref:dynactin subunit 3 n=1 Tax=Anabrus simplex TaxID=316456 RepID=UPI0034DD1E7A
MDESDALDLDLLEKRIEDLESKILGNLESTENLTPVADSLSNTNTLLLTATSGREKVNNVLNKRLHELEKYLSSVYDDYSPASIAAMYEIILLEEPFLRSNIAMLNQIKELRPVLDSEHIRNVPDLKKRLEDLTVIYLDKKEAADSQGTEFMESVAQYNKTIIKLTKAFVVLDEIVTRLEIQAQPKKIEE